MPQPPWLQSALTTAREMTGLALTSPQLIPVHGGDINTSYQLRSPEAQLFIKTNNSPVSKDMFTAEREGLTALSQCDAVKVPNVIAQGNHEQTHYLVLEYVPMQTHGNWWAMGKALASLHRITDQQFGWPTSNFIGTSPQINSLTANWSDFWWQNRIIPQLDYCRNNGLSELTHIANRLKDINDQILGNHEPLPSLLHGDLWSGNAAFTDDGAPCLYDPACYHGDREADLALTELFGGFPTEFYDGYNSEWPISGDYSLRKEWYNLYHLMNHANLFGGHYVSSCLTAMERCEHAIG